MNEIPALPTAQIKLVVTDPAELAKGVAIADKGGLKHLARHGNKLFAEAEGSGSSPYKVQIVHDPEKGYRGRCSCMAARSRPFCKHASALLVLWARDTNAFAVAESAPESAGDPGAPAKRAKAKTGKVDAKELMRQGVEQTLTLVRELALSGITTMSEERITQVRALAETLRAERLRRMSARLFELAATLSTAARDYAALDTDEYGVALTDLWLAARRVQKHLDGEALPLEHVETLIGRSWTKKDRAPVQGLDLIEYAFVQEITADDFVIRESRFLDMASGTHFSEKQILPAFLAKRTAPKRSYEGFLLAGAGGGRYPGFAPHRLDLSEPGSIQTLATDSISRIRERALPGVAGALTRLSEHRKDVFAPDSVPVAVQLDSLMAEGDRLLALDESGDSLLIAGDPSAQIALTSALAGAHLQVILGDLLLLGAVPALQPLALVVERNGTAALEALPAVNAEALLSARKGRRKEPAPGARRPRWIDTARELGVGAAAIALGEVREELADILSEGVSTLTSRRADGLVERLRQLNLPKPAALLAETAQHADPARKIDDVVRLLQVLGIGLNRLAASRNIDRSRLARSPLHPAIIVAPPAELLNVEALIQELHANRLVGHGRAIAIDRALDSFDTATLARLAPTLFGDGSVSSLVAQRYAAQPGIALEMARDFLADGKPHYSMKGWTAPARVARYTSVQMLQRMASPEARTALRSVGASKDPALQNLIYRALKPDSIEKVPEAILDELKAGNWETRATALDRVRDQGCLAALPHVRRIAAADPSVQVRYRAWYTQAALLDVDAVPLWIAVLKDRAANDDAGREALHALAHIGDNRSIAPLLDAFEEGYKPTLVAEALRAFGPAIVPPLIDRLEARPDLVERKVTADIGAGVEWPVVDKMLAQRLAVLPPETFASCAQIHLKFFNKNPDVQKAVAELIQARIAGAGFEVPGDLKRALTRAQSKTK
jgi:hypothetical protein